MIRQRTQDRLIGLLENHARKITDDVWQRMDASQRIEELTGHSLDNCRAILDLPLQMAVMSPTVMQGKVQVIRAILTAVTKVGIESGRLRAMQDELLDGLINDFDAQEKKPPPANGQKVALKELALKTGRGAGPPDWFDRR